MISTRMFITFKAPPKQLLFLDKRYPKTENEPRETSAPRRRSRVYCKYTGRSDNVLSAPYSTLYAQTVTGTHLPTQSLHDPHIETLFYIPPPISILRRSSHPCITSHDPFPFPNTWADFLDFVKGEKNELELFEDTGPSADKTNELGPVNHTQIHISQVITTTNHLSPSLLPAFSLKVTISTQTIKTLLLQQTTTTSSFYVPPPTFSTSPAKP
eukprot:TRINITY_DN1948_c0_g2_i11.p1 TRINITY_DN1948_c0_g2~~TRINITY_DN1948_c0_g2_i11.p1  ORF type:complete len:213 (-),score=10.40 TRINITY_DN1948_c0_g2_i11:1467-2105(-)